MGTKLIYRIEDEDGIGAWTNCHSCKDSPCPENFKYGTQSLRNIRWWIDLDCPPNIMGCKVSVYRVSDKMVKFPRIQQNWRHDYKQRTFSEVCKLRAIDDGLDIREVFFCPANAVLIARLEVDSVLSYMKNVA